MEHHSDTTQENFILTDQPETPQILEDKEALEALKEIDPTAFDVALEIIKASQREDKTLIELLIKLYNQLNPLPTMVNTTLSRQTLYKSELPGIGNLNIYKYPIKKGENGSPDPTKSSLKFEIVN